jgi:cytochrome c peroxidase
MYMIILVGFTLPIWLRTPISNADDADGLSLHPLRVELGKMLFFDPMLSGSNRISCSSCHLPSHYFSDSLSLSIGHNGARTKRNSMSLVNLAYANAFFWDGQATTLEDFIFHPITNKDEMNQNSDSLVLELQADSMYLRLFETCFPIDGITTYSIAVAISTYVRTLTSSSSYLDSIIQAVQRLDYNESLNHPTMYKQALFPNISHRAIKALNLCEQCHGGFNYGGVGFRNNGLDSLFQDSGRYYATGQIDDIGKFKVVSLRNIANTYPYMHDGRFRSLIEVIQHYNSGIQYSASLDTLLMDSLGNPIKLGLNEEEIDDMIQFLNLLTDNAFLSVNAK